MSVSSVPAVPRVVRCCPCSRHYDYDDDGVVVIVIACAVVIPRDIYIYKSVRVPWWFVRLTSFPKQAQRRPVAATETWSEPLLAHQTWTAAAD